MNMNVSLGFKNHFDIAIHHADGSITELPNCANLILDQGLEWLGSADSSKTQFPIVAVTVGTGNAPVNASDTTLNAPLAFTTNRTASTLSTYSTVAPYNNTFTYQFTFPVGGVVGNIAEVGAMYTNPVTGANPTIAGGALWSRALIMVGGSPGTISVLATDQLVVSYVVKVIVTDITSGTLSIIQDGTPVNYDYQIAPVGINFVGGNLPFVANTSSGALNQATLAAVTQPYVTYTWQFNTTTITPYVANSRSRQSNYHFNTGTARTARLFFFGFPWMSFQMLLSSPVTIATTQTFDISMLVSWANAV